MDKARLESAVREFLTALGEDPKREGLQKTPLRVAKAWADEFCRGYQEDPRVHLKTMFEEVEGYQGIVLLKDIPFNSYCEHHLAPIRGKAHIAYLPSSKVVGISKLARVLEGYSRRLQIQERLTSQVRCAIDEELSPRGAAVIIKAEHSCISSRGANKHGVSMTTSSYSGVFESVEWRTELFNLIGCK